MRALFVVAAGYKSGLGHLLRSRELLLELSARGHAADLWLHGDDTTLSGRAWPDEMQVFRSDDSGSIGLACEDIGRLLEHGNYDWVVIDGYEFSGKVLCESFAARGPKLLVLDDLADRELRTDLLLNQNTVHAQTYGNSPVEAERLLLGPQFALVDHKYFSVRTPGRTHGELRSLLISFGGVDRHNRTQRVVELVASQAKPLDIVVVVGPYYPYLEQLQSVRGRHALRVVQNARDLAVPMRQCDLMVTAGGSTVWQACCVGTPMLVLQTVDNQALVIKTLREFDAALCLDASARADQGAGVAGHEFAAAFEAAADATVRARLAENALRLVDGNGAGRVADELESWEQGSFLKK